MAKFNVGDEIKVTQNTSFIGDKKTSGWHVGGQGVVKIGAIGIVESVLGDFIKAKFKKEDVDECTSNFSRKLRFDEIELVESKPTKNKRITALEETVAKQSKEISELKLIVHELRERPQLTTVINNAPQEPSTTNTVEDTPKMTRLVNGQWQPTTIEEVAEMMSLTPNQQRAAVIEKAKKFVEVNSNKKHFHVPYCDGSGLTSVIFGSSDALEFVVNEDKRTVVALIKSFSTRHEVYHRGITKCNPNDVFNEHIGKAIALGRALGLDV
ncbi:hypothetical protein QUF87_00285, partial [Lysinibacillus pakistanensis]|nr:hypothetical protein [Lysinibacillus pakistanensis]